MFIPVVNVDLDNEQARFNLFNICFMFYYIQSNIVNDLYMFNR